MAKRSPGIIYPKIFFDDVTLRLYFFSSKVFFLNCTEKRMMDKRLKLKKQKRSPAKEESQFLRIQRVSPKSLIPKIPKRKSS